MALEKKNPQKIFCIRLFLDEDFLAVVRDTKRGCEHLLLDKPSGRLVWVKKRQGALLTNIGRLNFAAWIDQGGE